jgi:hypothetical protein
MIVHGEFTIKIDAQIPDDMCWFNGGDVVNNDSRFSRIQLVNIYG